MKNIVKGFASTTAALMLAFTMSACTVEKTADGEMPEVDVDVEPGKLPEYDVDTAEIEVGTQEATVSVPDIDVEMKERTVKVPEIDVKMPSEDEEPPSDS